MFLLLFLLQKTVKRLFPAFFLLPLCILFVYSLASLVLLVFGTSSILIQDIVKIHMV